MKEIDFLPEWYKNGMRMRGNHRTQYIALGCIFAMLVVWNFVTAGAISKSVAQAKEINSRVSELWESSEAYSKLMKEMRDIQGKASVLEKIDSKVDVSSVLAEIGFIVKENIYLSKIDIACEEFGGSAKQARASNKLRSVNASSDSEAKEIPDVRFKVTISGVASESKDVAGLICSLEDSEYFFQVIPSYSRNKEIGSSAKDGQSVQVSEFEVVCYLANYTEDKVVSTA
ncbi:MAG: hypothetical protein E4H40_07195, partial [Candidatus Brocadiia bacterium]